MPLTRKKPKAKLALAPAEILHQIFSYLSRADHKSLRQTCHSIKRLATGYVFFRAHISLLKTDHDAFFKISRRRHLAEVVEQVVWYDIPSIPDDASEWDIVGPEVAIDDGSSGEGLSEENSNDEEACSESEDAGIDFTDLVTQLAEQYRKALWLDNAVPSNAGKGSKKRGTDVKTTLEVFFDNFVTALARMPRLKDITVRPMASERTIAVEKNKYPLHMGILHKFSTSGDDAGVVLLLEAMKASSCLNVTTFRYADQPSLSNINVLDESYGVVFRKFETIDLCISKVQSVEAFDGLARCLDEAKELRHLKLCFENLSNPDQYRNLRAVKGEVFDLLFDSVQWQHLDRIELVDLHYSRKAMRDFIAKHTASLRHISLQLVERNPLEWADFLTDFIKQPDLRLDSILISHHERGDVIDPDWLLKKTRAKSWDSDTGAPFLSREEFFWDGDAWPGVVVHDIKTRPKAYEGLSVPPECEEHDSDGEDIPKNTTPPSIYWILDDLSEDGGRIVFYSVTSASDDDAYTTEVWRFCRADGSYAFSDPKDGVPDPLNYFEDWDPEAGDVAEPTPFGKAFDEFVEEQMMTTKNFLNNPKYVTYPDNAMLWRGGYESRPFTKRDKDAAIREYGW